MTLTTRMMRKMLKSTVYSAALICIAVPAYADWVRRVTDGIMGTRITVELWADDTAKADQAIVLHLVAWDENCPQHIPQLVSAEKVEGYLASLHARIAELESELRKATT